MSMVDTNKITTLIYIQILAVTALLVESKCQDMPMHVHAPMLPALEMFCF